MRFGVRDFDIGAFACTSRGQAHRVGKWSLLSERLETELVSFDTSNEGIYSRPGDVIEIYDGGTERYILVRVDSLDWQQRRNHSGLYPLEDASDDIPEASISEQLWERVTSQAFGLVK